LKQINIRTRTEIDTPHFNFVKEKSLDFVDVQSNLRLVFCFHPHLHFLVSEAGVFHKIPRIDDSRLADLFAHEFLAFLVHNQLPSPE
jgi:hypothetical protein